MNQKFYICKHCGNVIEKVEDKGVPVVCCGEVMKELQAGIEDAAFENIFLFIQWKVIPFMYLLEK